MINKQEILSFAKEAELQPTTVEKDYVLGWILYGISQHEQLSKWIFKGGTCLKKCYFETYRFSEDLDFTVPKGMLYEEKEIKKALEEISDIVYEQTGINAKNREIEVKESFNKKRSKTFTAKMTYRGPLDHQSKAQPRIKFDITDDEIIVEDPSIQKVFHPYSDKLVNSTQVRCYSINEILAEKTRAMYERQGRARDVFDVVNISRNFREDVDILQARIAVQKKFHFKDLPSPSVDLIFSQIDFAQLKANWDSQLRQQLPIVPPVESFYDDLKAALSWWLDEKPIELKLNSISNDKDESFVPRTHFPELPYQIGKRKGTGHYTTTASAKHLQESSLLDHIRYAARNRLLIEIIYHNTKRIVEPYSLRIRKTGNILLYGFEQKKQGVVTSTHIKAYKVSEITDVQITNEPFVPRFIVEL